MTNFLSLSDYSKSPNSSLARPLLHSHYIPHCSAPLLLRHRLSLISHRIRSEGEPEIQNYASKRNCISARKPKSPEAQTAYRGRAKWRACLHVCTIGLQFRPLLIHSAGHGPETHPSMNESRGTGVAANRCLVADKLRYRRVQTSCVSCGAVAEAQVLAGHLGKLLNGKPWSCLSLGTPLVHQYRVFRSRVMGSRYDLHSLLK